ncbi:4-hydroxy-3-methylbut-2-enyl diphosphate reductase [Mycoplasmoides pirum]|uniref:4-hydroxy-3-methylbut-2-enyl diphosphate reductase n=1 Tax=Mycoplasmoides pirum TaxID=2122 RepID=UPI000484B7DA|nr:4-hydroxy-3-methylbut-2-enyl diphosphate reductase [Mycoplasmoides pirum]
MQLIKISPRGFCTGVINAFAITKNVALNNPNKKIYMLGWLVHNEHVVKEMLDLGVIVLDDKIKDRKSLILEIDNTDEPIVIFSAHGTDQKVIDLAKKRNLRVIDLTCVYVTQTHDLIKEKLNEGYNVFYIGVSNHPETISALSIDEKIILLESAEDVNKLKCPDKKIFVTNQTTISIYEFYDVIKALRLKYKNIEFKNDICNATNERQDALINVVKTLDLVIVVGDRRSNNSLKLVEIGKTHNVESHLVSNINDLCDNWFIDKQKVGITSGASTPDKITQKIIDTIIQRYNPEIIE